MKGTLLALLASIGAAAAPASAGAVQMWADYRGVVTAGYGANGELGGGPSVVGQAWRAVIEYDTDLGTTFGVPPHEDVVLQGGGLYGTTTPITRAFFRLKGVGLFNFTGAYQGRIVADEDALIIHSVADAADGQRSMFFWAYTPGRVGAVDKDVSSTDPIGAHIIFDGRSVDLQITSLTVRHGVLPEPSSWALMLGGFGLTGALLRRRAAKSASAGQRA
ncbi:MAG: PEPxxWA-CTERM sorting domain-containing protein [Phenylobacterium sp.]|uniref:PEPxxWA-CTERM sorting domain-containing protein n=1 Tax=Phenylobacterium sp. TaxID=1871053 RepID=UPI001A5AE413|nr:PEPxxWA-CTERM sorting domain-containing protein [Phenylobacterium sp.]MBL8555574.1 PEPxxWA-CTERM sorting domain-containing protein [Phenylobacterium sp.]